MLWCFIASYERLPIIKMFDCDCEETSEPDEAMSLVAIMPDGNFLSTMCRRDQITQVQIN